MRKHSLKVIMAALAMVSVVSFGGFAASNARADAGGSIVVNDGRYNPMSEDRVVVYVQDAGVDIWGLDSSLSGVHLTFFTASELASGQTIVRKTDFGTVTLTRDSAATTHLEIDATTGAESTVVDTTAWYHVTWTGAFGADGSAAFVKTFDAVYAG